MTTMPEITIAGRKVGTGHAPFVIAECGINDGGDKAQSAELVLRAKQAGCDAVKWQKHVPAESDTRQPWQRYDTVGHAAVCAHCAGPHSIAFGCTMFHASAFGGESVDFIKIGSGEVSNHQLVEAACKASRHRERVPVLLSTGMHTLAEIDAAVAILRSHAVPFAVLECTSTYPARHGEVRLSAIAELRERYPDAVIGISDHTPDIWTALGAVALGASIVEKHFTVSRAWGGPDNPLSIEPDEMARLCTGARAIHAAMSSGGHRVSEAEAETAQWARSGVYAARDIPRHEFIRDHLTMRRPPVLNQPSASHLLEESIVASCDIKAGEPITYDNSEDWSV